MWLWGMWAVMHGWDVVGRSARRSEACGAGEARITRGVREAEGGDAGAQASGQVGQLDIE
jgi:hypothetical protein